tara:strand:+ start:3297 stop:5207 length:1911 start_codon:yes stop_codon:yes gene_type:complete
MKFRYEDIINHLSEQPSKELLSDKIFQLGHEHEINGNIFDIDFTPNRGDCLSLIGLTRDLKSFFEHKEVYETYEDDIDNLEINFVNNSPKDCPKITFLEIEIEQKSIKKYKSYLENYFSVLGNNKTNFFTDISNYVSYEQGQPTHCFDSNFIDNEITFENKTCDEVFKTLLDTEIELKGNNCVFTKDNKIISLAGIMGGSSSACSAETKKVLVECAYFNPESIVGKSVKYNLNSDAAHKFERGVDVNSQEKVLRRYIKIVQDHAEINNIKIKSISEIEFNNKTLPFDNNKISRILGTRIKKDDYHKYLSDLGFTIKGDEVTVPSFRHDIFSQNDLAEEIARIIGYNNIKSMPMALPSNKYDKTSNSLKIKNLLINNGFTEVINFPFTSISDEQSIVIDNPLDSNKKYLRTSLKNSLLDNLLYNERRQKDSIKLFEISNIYSKDLSNQHKKLGIIISGRQGKNYNDFNKQLDKKYLNHVLNSRIDIPVFEVNEIAREKLRTKKNEKIYYTEILIDEIPEKFYEDLEPNNQTVKFNKYMPVSEFPSSTRDFSFSITNPQKYENVIQHIKNFKHEFLKESYIFDFYVNYKKDEIKVGVRLVFQSALKTLSDKQIQEALNMILKPVINLNDVFIPGLELK